MVGIPFWMSTANAELGGNGWGSNIRTQARLSADGWMSGVAGRNVITMPGGTHYSPAAPSMVSGQTYFIIVPSNAIYIGTNTSTPALTITPPSGATVTLIVNAGAQIYGRGGAGGSVTRGVALAGTDGGDGGPALRINSLVTVQNSGTILGGGGGGRAIYFTIPYAGVRMPCGGGGGAPYGAGGTADISDSGTKQANPGSAGGLTSGGAGGNYSTQANPYGGFGGNVGSNGSNGVAQGGLAISHVASRAGYAGAAIQYV